MAEFACQPIHTALPTIASTLSSLNHPLLTMRAAIHWQPHPCSSELDADRFDNLCPTTAVKTCSFAHGGGDLRLWDDVSDFSWPIPSGIPASTKPLDPIP